MVGKFEVKVANIRLGGKEVLITLNSVYNNVTFNDKSAITRKTSAPNISHSPINMLPLMKSHL